jgi:predicted transcriptional regulator
MIHQDTLSERVAFRLTAETRRKLEQWAREEHRPLANLIFIIVYQAIRDEETRRGQPFDGEERDVS